MIAIIDLACTRFSHEMFNAGTINQVHLAFPKDSIVYFAERQQINCVKKLLNLSDSIGFEPIEYHLDGTDEAPILNKIIKRNREIRVVVITSFISMKMDALHDIIEQNKHIKFVFLLHGIFEYLISDREKLHCRLPLNMDYRLFLRQLHIIFRRIRLKKTSPKDILAFRESLHSLALLSNVYLIAFSNEYQKYHSTISEEIRKKINVLYLPYIYDFTLKNKVPTNTVKIGIMPSTHQAADGYARSLAYYAYLHSRKVKSNYIFEIINGDKSWLCLKRHVHITNKEPLDRLELNKILYDCDWILLPYDKYKYQLSSSGVFFDAINMEVPCIMGPSNCFNDFDKYSVGIHVDSFQTLKKQLLRIIKEPNFKETLEYRKNIRDLKYKMNDYNINAFKELLQ